MAVDSTVQKLNIATNLIAQSAKLVDAYIQYQKWDLEYVKTGINYQAGDFDNTSLKHVNPTDVTTLITQLRAFKTWVETNGNGDIFFKVQNGA